VDHLDPVPQAALSRTAQVNMAGYDTLGACIFAGFGFAAVPESVRDLLNARYDWGAGADILQVLGRETLTLEREFNRRAGFTAADDRLPEWMAREPLPPTGAVFNVLEEELTGSLCRDRPRLQRISIEISVPWPIWLVTEKVVEGQTQALANVTGPGLEAQRIQPKPDPLSRITICARACPSLCLSPAHLRVQDGQPADAVDDGVSTRAAAAVSGS
jgi:hypothetical protein